jgi:hypothetical protein
MSLSQLETIANIISAFATLAALIVGGVWGYYLFWKRRQRYPHANLEHRITHRHIGYDKVLLHVDLRISNIGDVLMSLASLETRIQRVLPLSDDLAESIGEGRDPVPEGGTEVAWPLYQCHEQEFRKGECEIEPGESQDINHDFIVDTGLETVEVYSYVTNERKAERTLVWDLTTLYDLTNTG